MIFQRYLLYLWFIDNFANSLCLVKQSFLRWSGDIRFVFTVLAIPENNVELIHAGCKVTLSGFVYFLIIRSTAFFFCQSSVILSRIFLFLIFFLFSQLSKIASKIVPLGHWSSFNINPRCSRKQIIYSHIRSLHTIIFILIIDTLYYLPHSTI